MLVIWPSFVPNYFYVVLSSTFITHCFSWEIEIVPLICSFCWDAFSPDRVQFDNCIEPKNWNWFKSVSYIIRTAKFLFAVMPKCFRPCLFLEISPQPIASSHSALSRHDRLRLFFPEIKQVRVQWVCKLEDKAKFFFFLKWIRCESWFRDHDSQGSVANVQYQALPRPLQVTRLYITGTLGQTLQQPTYRGTTFIKWVENSFYFTLHDDDDNIRDVRRWYAEHTSVFTFKTKKCHILRKWGTMKTDTHARNEFLYDRFSK